MNKFIDTHCHFDFPVFYDDIANSLSLAHQARVEKIIIPAVARWNFDVVAELANHHHQLYCALGLHPLYIEEHAEQHLLALEQKLKTVSRCVAIGEIGLDDYMENPQPEKQEAFLIAQLKLAIKFDLPVILHSRKTHDKLSALLRRYDVPRKGVIHGFAGSLQQAEKFIQLGYFIGVGGTITYERAQKTRRAIASLPLEYLLLETDAPDMPVSGFQGEPNRPERIQNVFSQLCELRQGSPEVIAEQLYLNSLQLFGLNNIT
ncbi:MULTISPECIES: TatD family hydrolase [Proteus]|uniref:TatD family hydrolase n=1 Tax=Proteus TaxID=583 RepID=UPI000BFDF618|nr:MULTISPECIES: TatD family hydrolase [Proteus]ATM99452.1 metal-dependent hydrolase [Proteus vulgaris]MBG2838681.1 TatD family hydrolase [Proteus terrae subsp. cibarius]MBG2870253.1 TatD family hydrolase [Proteus terrae subsp. cibarius]MCS6714788.1 TatD family hydrolase [Proteus terrae]MCS6731638.1 TatD family hydrolase [Proteus terrae]